MQGFDPFTLDAHPLRIPWKTRRTPLKHLRKGVEGVVVGLEKTGSAKIVGNSRVASNFCRVSGFGDESVSGRAIHPAAAPRRGLDVGPEHTSS